MSKKITFNKKNLGFFMEKTQPSGLNGYIPRYIPRPILVGNIIKISVGNIVKISVGNIVKINVGNIGKISVGNIVKISLVLETYWKN